MSTTDHGDDTTSAGTTIFEAIRADHEKQRTLVDLLLKTSGDSDGRRELFARLKRELESHAGAEERFLYVPLMEHDATQEKARHSVSEHKELDDFVEQLEGYDMSAPQWIETARDLCGRLTHHLDEEEHEVFQLAGRYLDDADKTRLADDYAADMSRRRDG
jgi:hemerythrin-like domain-containing protein